MGIDAEQRVSMQSGASEARGAENQGCGMTGENPTGANRSPTSLPREFFDGGVEYEIVEGELLPRGPHARAWDPAVDLRF